MEVDCKYFLSVSGVYTCKVSTANIISPRTEIKMFKGIHDAGQDKYCVLRIIFKNTIVHFIPKGIINTFPNVRIIKIDNCGLQSISREDLDDFDNLEEFQADFNQLTSLPCGLFIGKSKLQTISLYSNQLESISSLLLKPLLNNPLSMVDLRCNVSINKLYSAKSSHGCKSIEDLMKAIDKQCSQPSEDKDGFTDETFDKKLLDYSAELWTTGKFSDFTIIADGLSTGDTVKDERKKFNVHKLILRLHSSVFAAMFENDVEETRTNKMTIVDFSISAVEQFLGFLYTGSVADDVNAMELFALAVKYDIPALKKLSEKKILLNVGEENALDIFNLGHLYSSNDLKQEAFRTIQQMFPGIRLGGNLMNNSEGLKKLIDAEKNRKMKKKEADDELAAATMTYTEKIQENEEQFSSVLNKVNKKIDG